MPVGKPKTKDAGHVPGKSRVSALSVLVALGGVSVLAFYYLIDPDNASTEGGFPRGCLFNLKSIASALTIYAEDHDGMLPPAIETLFPKYLMADSKPYVVHCPYARGRGNDGGPQQDNAGVAQSSYRLVVAAGLVDDLRDGEIVVKETSGAHSNTVLAVVARSGAFRAEFWEKTAHDGSALAPPQPQP